jgi:hypothetical protein
VAGNAVDRWALADSASNLYTTNFKFSFIQRLRLRAFRRRAESRSSAAEKIEGERGCMGRLRRKALEFSLAALFLYSMSGCGGHRPPGVSQFPAKINLIPSPTVSLQLGSYTTLAATAQNASGSNVNAAFSFTSSDTSIVNVAPGGVACGGVWNSTYTVCTPGATGVAEVTASADGVTSAPTLVFVHPPIDYMTVNGIALNSVIPQEPCLSQGMTMTVQAHAFSQGVDITSSVGTFTWSANNSSVVKITPIVTNVVLNGITFPIALDQATLTAATPGITQIYATANGAASTPFQQTQYTNALGALSPPLDFFATCNIQNISLEVGPSAIEQTGQTTFVTSKGTSENVTAVVTDLFGYTSLPTSNGGVVLSNIPLTWSASQPAVIATGSSCVLSCGATTPSVGSATITASCSPPTCNVGFPYVPASLSTPALITACSNFFGVSCEQLIPEPVYATSPVMSNVPQTGGVSGLVTGSTATATVLATSTGCATTIPETCTTGLYNVTTGRVTAGGVSVLPSSPNSMLYDLAGDKAYVGSEFGALIVNPTNLGTSNGAFTSLGNITGQILGISNSGTQAAFSDTVQNPNSVYIVNASSASAITSTQLNISAASTAAFSPDGMEAFIVGGSGGNELYIYSPLQALQGPGLSTSSNPQFNLAGRALSIAFAPNGAFAFIAESSLNGSTPNLTAFSVCNNSIATNLTTSVPAVVDLPANPLFMRVLPAFHIPGTDYLGNPIPDGVHIFILDSTGFDIITATNAAQAAGTLCPQSLTLTGPQRIELNMGTIEPINFFASADASLLYIVNNNASGVSVYNFGTGSAGSGIPLAGNAVPVIAAITVDDGTIVIAANDGQLHELSTALGGTDQYQVQFPDLPDYLNSFCTYSPNNLPCALNLIAVRP